MLFLSLFHLHLRSSLRSKLICSLPQILFRTYFLLMIFVSTVQACKKILSKFLTVLCWPILLVQWRKNPPNFCIQKLPQAMIPSLILASLKTFLLESHLYELACQRHCHVQQLFTFRIRPFQINQFWHWPGGGARTFIWLIVFCPAEEICKVY